jgi:hypothetical protein
MLESLRSVEQFLDENADKLANVVNTGARQRLTAAIGDLSTHASEQTGSNLAAQGATQKKEALRQALTRDHMAPIARIAAADIPNLPELSPLRMPKGKPTAERLASYAYGMGAAAAPYTDTFTKAGLPADFITQLNTAADAVVAVVANRTNSRGKRRGATDGLKARLTEGRQVVHIIDAFVKSALKDDAALLGNWNLVKRVTKTSSGRVAGTTPSAAAASPSSPTSPKPEDTAAVTHTPTTAAPAALASPASPASPTPTPLAETPPASLAGSPPLQPSTSPPATPAAG